MFQNEIFVSASFQADTASGLFIQSVPRARVQANSRVVGVYGSINRLQPQTYRAEFGFLVHSLSSDRHGDLSGTGREVDRDWLQQLYRLGLKTIIPMIHRSVSCLSLVKPLGSVSGIGESNWGQTGFKKCITKRPKQSQPHAHKHTHTNLHDYLVLHLC